MVVPASLRAFWSGPGRRPAWRRRVARRVLAAVLAAAAAAVAVGLLRTPAPAPPVRVVVAARAIAAGSVLTDDDVRLASVPPDLAPAAGSAPRTVADVVGRVAAGALEDGEPLRASRLLGPGALAALPAGQVAVPVDLPGGAVAAAVQVGGTVDVVVRGRTTVSRAAVLAVVGVDGGRAGLAADRVEPGGTGQALLAVTRADALALAASTGDPLSPAAPVVLVRPPLDAAPGS